MNAWWGTVAAYPLNGSMPTPARANQDRSPITPPRSGPNAALYPTSIHSTLMRAMTMNDCMIVLRMFFRRTIPP